MKKWRNKQKNNIENGINLNFKLIIIFEFGNLFFKCVREKSSIIINTGVRRSVYRILAPLNHVNLKFRLIKAFPVKVELQNVIGYVYRHGMPAGGAAQFFASRSTCWEKLYTSNKSDKSSTRFRRNRSLLRSKTGEGGIRKIENLKNSK